MRRLLFGILAALLLAGCGPNVDDISRDLKSSDEDAQERALEYARRMQRPDLAPQIVPMLYSDEGNIQKLAVKALDWLENPEVLYELEKAAEETELTEEIIEVIYHFDDPDAVPVLEKYLTHDDEDIRKDAAKYIRSIDEHLNPDIVFYSIGRPVRSTLALIVYSQAILWEPGQVELKERMAER